MIRKEEGGWIVSLVSDPRKGLVTLEYILVVLCECSHMIIMCLHHMVLPFLLS